eukprot:CAMPEP_0198199086 /NCGR_PEP_ID=MMETSP1445-20131203/2418_1 /TAXON_ID=36898 /ORGANISM="Pyramimonas sp., Strain CCMP2087" /LENGTH=381 /DNA_ID=CAMNT_0043868813 /DNA_START=264 /DNA_END=1406 /DNA_ORIENTATION=+
MRESLYRGFRLAGSLHRALSSRSKPVTEQAYSRSVFDGVQPGSLQCSWKSPRHFSSESHALPDFRFGAAFSQADTLAQAVSEAVGLALGQLQGAPPHLCQLMVSSSYKHQDMASLFAHECLSCNGNSPPHIIGGVVPGCIAGDRQAWKGRSVSVMVASLPGVKINSFSLNEPSIPDLPRDTWQSLLRASSSADGPAVATILLSEPSFVEVEQLLARLHSVLPHSSLVGGIVGDSTSKPDQGETDQGESGKGATLFLGPTAVKEGAVGVVLEGAFELDTLCLQGFRSVGPTLKVTEAVGSLVLELNDRPAMEQLQDIRASLPYQDRQLPVKMGIIEPSTASDRRGGNRSKGPKRLRYRHMVADMSGDGFEVRSRIGHSLVAS